MNSSAPTYTCIRSMTHNNKWGNMINEKIDKNRINPKNHHLKSAYKT